MILYHHFMVSQFASLAGFMEHYKDEDTCLKAFEAARFRNGDYCPHCGNTIIYRFKSGKRFRCAGCKQDFTIKTRTVFGESKVPLRKWFIAIYLLTTAKKGISSLQLATQVGVTQKTAWFMDHRIRKAMKRNKGQLWGTIEVDETYIGGKEKNKHKSKRVGGTRGRSLVNKTPIVGMLQRDGEIRAEVVENTGMRTVEQKIVTHCAPGSQIFTDDYASYNRIQLWFNHEKVCHSTGEYTRKGNIHSNGAESFWALFKRGYIGIYHYMSAKHLQRYVDEFTYRFNARESSFATVFDALINSTTDTANLPYEVLTA